MSSVIVTKASVILAFRFVISGTGVKNTLTLTYPIKRSQGRWYPAIVVARVSDNLSQSTCIETLNPKTNEHQNTSMELHHLVGKLCTAETILTEVQHKVSTCPRSSLVINVCNQGKTLFDFRFYAHPVYPYRRDYICDSAWPKWSTWVKQVPFTFPINNEQGTSFQN